MTDYISSPSMGLFLPIPGVAPGPNYAYEQNSSFMLVDSHDHSTGKGVKVNPSGLNINADLTFLNNNATSLRSVRFFAQGSPLALSSDVGCLYESGVDLYYNDGAGNRIRITQSGGIAGTPGSISGLVAPASASYVPLSQTFIFQSNVNTPANIDVASVILRNLSSGSFGLTLSPPAAMGANYSLVLPALPASKKIMTLDASGNMVADYDVDNTTLVILGNNLQVKDGGITTAKIADGAVTTVKIADGAVTKVKLAAVGQQISASCNGFSDNSTSVVDVTNLTVTITTIGRPVFVGLISDGSGNNSFLAASSSDTGQNNLTIFIKRGATLVSQSTFSAIKTGTSTDQKLTVGSFPWILDVPAAGTYTYKVQMSIGAGGVTATGYVNYLKLIAYEL